MQFQIPTVLFICTGNIFRSRFAEAVFNHHAQSKEIGWCAFSRGLDTTTTDFDGLSRHTRSALESRGIELHHTAANKAPLTEEDLEMAHIIIALSEAEHRPMISRQFPDWLPQFNFWEIADLPLSPPEEALARIDSEVQNLLRDLVASAGE